MMSSTSSESVQEGNGKKDVFADFDPEVRVRTKKMLMYFIIFAILMLFAGFTSAYIVSNMGEFWVHIEAPGSLWTSNLIIALSSLTIWLSLRAMKQGNVKMSQLMLAATLVLGIGFTLTQKAAWDTLAEKGMGWTVNENEQGLKAYKWNNVNQIKGEYGVDYYVHKDGKRMILDGGEFYSEDDVFKANPLTTEVQRITNNSGAYVWALIIIHILHLVFGLIYLVVNLIRSYTGIIHPKDTVRLQTNGLYWHFLGILWIYLFLFLFVIH